MIESSIHFYHGRICFRSLHQLLIPYTVLIVYWLATSISYRTSKSHRWKAFSKSNWWTLRMRKSWLDYHIGAEMHWTEHLFLLTTWSSIILYVIVKVANLKKWNIEFEIRNRMSKFSAVQCTGWLGHREWENGDWEIARGAKVIIAAT